MMIVLIQLSQFRGPGFVHSGTLAPAQCVKPAKVFLIIEAIRALLRTAWASTDCI